MTHDELLANINSNNFMQSRTLETPYFALRAVANLHKPFLFEDAPDVYALACANCQMPAVGERYPCETIEAIEKELA
jgi:hypothetical protein